MLGKDWIGGRGAESQGDPGERWRGAQREDSAPLLHSGPDRTAWLRTTLLTQTRLESQLCRHVNLVGQITSPLNLRVLFCKMGL